MTALPAHAQVPFDARRDRNDLPIPGVVENTMAYAGMATSRMGIPSFSGTPAATRDCPGRNRSTSTSTSAPITPWGTSTITPSRLEMSSRPTAGPFSSWSTGHDQEPPPSSLERSRQTVRGDDTHLGGEAHVRSLEQCLSVRTDERVVGGVGYRGPCAQDSFAARRGRLLDSTSTPQVFEAPPTSRARTIARSWSRPPLPGVCRAEGRVGREALSGAREDHAGWLPPGWTSTSRAAAPARAGRSWPRYVVEPRAP